MDPLAPTGPSPYPDREQERPYEEGLPLPEADLPEGLPPGSGKWAIPHYYEFSQIVNLASRTYRWTFDEALRASHQNALALRRDPVVMDALRQRQIPTAQLPWHLDCENDQDSAQVEAVEGTSKIIEAIPRFQELKIQLLEAIFYGRYGVQVTWGWDFKAGQKRLCVRDHRPINGDKLVFKYSGQAGVLVHATYPGNYQLTDRGRAHFFSPEEREQVLIHQYEPEDADFFEGDLAGAVHGVGIRSRLYWLWFLKAQVSAFLMDYLERVGAGGFTIYYYEQGNPASLAAVTDACKNQIRNNTILFPRYRDGSTGGPGIERVEPSQAGATLLQTLITEYFDERITQYILGEGRVADAQGAGLGGSITDVLEGNTGRRIKYDAIALQDTLTRDLVHVIQRYMYPGVPPMRFVFDVDKPNAAEVLGAAQAFFEMGGTLDEDEIRSIIGLAKPQPGHSMLAKFGGLSPSAAGAQPEGVPMVGPTGPAAGGQPDLGAPPPDAAPAGAPVAPDATPPPPPGA